MVNIYMVYDATKGKAPKHSTDRFTSIHFQNIVSRRSGKDGRGVHAVVFNCDTLYDKTIGNCIVD
jgi:hypothetical protein